uniref:AlNc14C255G9712 protein n=1 Tax=Albugo laibachii Nc14 TaxID=890382 RepID=F0WTN6_9STRA|nr:AlNc14C255G9712 [Albugo laibachii Nc14]|eukprot:CCA24728.1 AlNc14C255G9712 [Albugo laibachii Nc14]
MENHKFVHHFRTCPSSIILDTGSDSQHHKEENIMLISGKSKAFIVLLPVNSRSSFSISMFNNVYRKHVGTFDVIRPREVGI